MDGICAALPRADYRVFPRLYSTTRPSESLYELGAGFRNKGVFDAMTTAEPLVWSSAINPMTAEADRSVEPADGIVREKEGRLLGEGPRGHELFLVASRELAGFDLDFSRSPRRSSSSIALCLRSVTLLPMKKA